MPIFAAHAVSAELSNGSTHEFTSAGSPSAEICASNAKRSRHVQVDEASSSEASSDEASSSSPRPRHCRAAVKSIAAFSRVEAAATDERDESAPRRLPNAVFSSETQEQPPALGDEHRTRSPPRPRAPQLELLRLLPPVRVPRPPSCGEPGRPSTRWPTPSSSHADDELVRHVEAARSRVSRETRRVGGLVREGLVREGLVRAAVRGAVVAPRRTRVGDASSPSALERRDREVTSKEPSREPAARRRSRRRGGRRGARGEAAARGSARRAYAGRSRQHRPFHCSASGFTGSPSRAIGVTSGNPLI